MPITGTAVLSAVEGGVQLYSSLHKLKKDKEELAKLKTPFYKVQDEYFQNRNLANQEAQGGLSASTKDYYTGESDRGLGAGIGAIEASGGNPNDISKLFDTYDKSIDRISSADADAHLKNIQYFMNANKDLAGQKTTQWGINEYQPYQNKLKELTQRSGADEKSAWNGANNIIGSVSAYGTGKQNQEALDALTKKGGTGGVPSINNMFGGLDPHALPSLLGATENMPIATINNRRDLETQTALASGLSRWDGNQWSSSNNSNGNAPSYEQYLQFINQGE